MAAIHTLHRSSPSANTGSSTTHIAHLYHIYTAQLQETLLIYVAYTQLIYKTHCSFILYTDYTHSSSTRYTAHSCHIYTTHLQHSHCSIITHYSHTWLIYNTHTVLIRCSFITLFFIYDITRSPTHLCSITIHIYSFTITHLSSLQHASDKSYTHLARLQLYTLLIYNYIHCSFTSLHLTHL